MSVGSHLAPRGGYSRYLIAFVAYLLVTLVTFFPLIRHLDSAVLFEPGDLSSTARDYWAADRQGKTPFTFTHDRLIYSPEGRGVAPALQIANFVQPTFVRVLDGVVGRLGALNLYMLLGFLMSGFVTFALLDRLRFRPLASFFGGYIFAFSWWQLEQAFFGHIGLNHLWIFPLLVLEFLWLRRVRSTVAALTLGATLGFSFYLFSYLGLLSSLVVALLTTVDAIEGWRDSSLRRRAFGLITIWGTALVALVPALLARRLAPEGFSASFVFTKDRLGGAKLRDYFIPSAHEPGLGRLFGARDWPPHVGDSVVFFGYSTLALGLAGVVIVLRSLTRQDEGGQERAFVTRFAAILVPVALLMSLPAYWTVAGHRLPVPNAAYVIGSFVSWWKFYMRFGVLVGFALAILAALAIHKLGRSATGRIASVAIVSVAILEFLPGTPVPTWRLDHQSAAVTWLKGKPGGIVANYPMEPYLAAYLPTATNWSALTWTNVYDQTRHGHPLYAVQSLPMTGGRTERIRLATRDLNQPLTARVLRGEGVRFVVVDLNGYRQLALPAPRPAKQFREAANFGNVRIYTLTGPALPGRDLFSPLLTPAVTRVAGFEPEETYAGEPARWMKQNGLLLVENPNSNAIPIRYRFTLRGFSNRLPRRLDLIDGTGKVLGRTVVDLPDQDYSIGPITLPKGASRLRLRVSPGVSPLGGDDPREESVFVRRVTVSPIARTLAGQLAKLR